MGGRQIIIFIVGLAVAAVVTVFGTIWIVDNFLTPPDPRDPLAKQGGLRPDQDIRQK
jgi:hypothetical protein